MIGTIPRSLAVHDGTFHADEVTACAILLHFELIDRKNITRTRNYDTLQTCQFVCDVGGQYDPQNLRFDHHQSSYEGTLSSAGMIWKYLLDEKTINEQMYHFFNDKFIHGVDQVDNGIVFPPTGHADFSFVIDSFLPVSYEATEAEIEEAFYKAVDFTLSFISHLEKKFQYLQQCKGKVSEVMELMNECLIFDQKLPWMEPFFSLGGTQHPAEFVIMPAGEHWKLRGIPPSQDKKKEVRKELPKSWAGKMGEDLAKESNIKGAVFCHKGLFISVWETKADALKALKYTLGAHEDNL